MSVGYLAGRYSRREELCGYAKDLGERGHEVRARWLKGQHQAHDLTNADGIPTLDAQEFAIDDLEDIAGADFLIAFTEEPRTEATRGGRHWEVGFASGLRFQRWPFSTSPYIHIVWPIEHVFMALPLKDRLIADGQALLDGRHADWAAFLKALDNGETVL